MEHLGTHADTLLLAAGADRTDHEFLEGDRGVGVGAAVDDVHHRNGKDIGVGTADIAVERDIQIVGCSVRAGEGDTEDGVGTKVLLGRRSIEFDHLLVDGPLVEDAHAFDHGSDAFVDIGHGFQRAFAQVAALVAVTEFEGFIFTGAGAARNGGTAHDATFQGYINLHGRIAARVEDLSCKNFFNNHCFKYLCNYLLFMQSAKI